MKNFKAITIDIFESPEIFQSVHGWPTEIEPGILEVEIRMPLYIMPSDVSTDVRVALDDNGFKEYRLANIGYCLAPKEFQA